MEKDPDGRYATAAELADDLRRFLEHRPICARRPAAVHRLLKWSRRHQTALVATCLVLLLAVIGLAVAAVLIWQEKTETGKALARVKEQERLAEVHAARATAQQRLAEAHAARATAQRERAESNLDWSLNAAYHVLAQLEGEEFADTPSAPEVRRRLTTHAIQLLLGRADESSADPAVRQDTARIYEAVGLLYSGQANHEAAREAFGKTSAILIGLTGESPDDARLWRDLAHARFYLAEEFASLGRTQEAARERRRLVEAYGQALRIDPNNVKALTNMAWHLATFPEASGRDPGRALELAQKAVALAPTKSSPWNTLGVAQYRTGDGRAAIASLTKSMLLRKGSSGPDWFYLAMAYWQVGEKEEARRWYAKAVSWVKANPMDQREFLELSAEAARQLGIEDPPGPKDKTRPQRKR
jgi:tetratricopeptide (TPR) repeat protein